MSGLSGDGERWWPGTAVAALCAVQFVDVLGVTVVVSTLPRMLSDLDSDPGTGTLVSTAYAMFFGGLLLLGARLGDRFGHRRVLLSGLAVFAVGAVLGAGATDLAVLVSARCVQGAAAALSVPAALTLLVGVTSDGTERDRAVALWSAAGAAAGAAGFVVGGVVADATSWRFIFLGYVVVATALAVGIARAVAPSAGAVRGANHAVGVDAGMVFTAAVMTAVLGLTMVAVHHQCTAGIVSLAGSAVAGAAFVLVDRRVATPLLPRSVVREPAVRVGMFVSLVNTATTSSSITLLTLYLQDTLRRDALTAAAMLLPFSVLVVVGSAMAARLMARLGARVVMTAGLVTIGGFNVALAGAANSVWAVPVAVGIGGVGIGLASVGATRVGTDVALSGRAAASGLLNTATQLGTAFGVAVLVLIAAATGRTPHPGVAAPTVAWLAAAAAAFMAGLLIQLRPSLVR